MISKFSVSVRVIYSRQICELLGDRDNILASQLVSVSFIVCRLLSVLVLAIMLLLSMCGG